MANFRRIARRKATKYGLNPNIFERQINQESGFNPTVTSPAGAQGIAQIMPATARGWGVDPLKPKQALDAAAKHMAEYVKDYGSYRNALIAYNAGPGAVGSKSLPAETQNYVATILNGQNPTGLNRSAAQSRNRVGAQSQTVTTTTPGVDNRAVRAGLILQYLQNQGSQPQTSSLVNLVSQLQDAQDIPATSTTTKVAGQQNTGTQALQTGLASGASTALGWAESKLGKKETGGENRGSLPDKLNKRFGFGSTGAQPWCAMFTSAAIQKGGAPADALSASVAEIRAKAKQKVGYRGFVKAQNAKPGDLILFGNSHIGMVKARTKNGLVMIAGNDSDQVQERTVSFSAGDVVRPDYAKK